MLLTILTVVTVGLLFYFILEMSKRDTTTELFICVLLLLGFIYKCEAGASELKLLDVESLDITIAKFGCNREPMTPQYECRDYLGRVAANFNLRLFEHGYWKNQVHTEGLEAQVKTVGWHWELGVRVHSALDVFYEHHSRHVMEGDQPLYYNERLDQQARGKFPVEDSYGIRLKFYTNPNPARSIFEE